MRIWLISKSESSWQTLLQVLLQIGPNWTCLDLFSTVCWSKLQNKNLLSGVLCSGSLGQEVQAPEPGLQSPHGVPLKCFWWPQSTGWTPLHRHLHPFKTNSSVPGLGAAPVPRTAAGPWMVTWCPGQSSLSGGPRACHYGDWGTWPTGPGTPRRNTSSSAGLRPGPPESEHTLSGARWACPAGGTPWARGCSAPGCWHHRICAAARRLAWKNTHKFCHQCFTVKDGSSQTNFNLKGWDKNCQRKTGFKNQIKR